MDWQERLRRDAVRLAFDDFDLVYHVGPRPAVPSEYEAPGLVALTFRLRPRASGGHVYVTTIDAGAALGLGARLGLDEGASLAMVDSHERVHVALQLEGVEEAEEEGHTNLVDAVWLSLRSPGAEGHVRAGDFGVVRGVDAGFWEALLES